jgi:hypothetical protein
MTYTYGKPTTKDKMPKPRKRMPQYDECLNEFIASDSNYWEVNMEALPSKDEHTVLSAFKWRIKNNPKFANIKAVMRNGRIFLEK